MGRRGDDARAALVEHAERLFAERGIESVSLRDVSAAAGQRNHSAAQYHFGDREGLVAAVYQARMSVINERRREHLERSDAEGLGHDVHALLAASVVPLVEVVSSTDGWYGRFLARTRWDSFANGVLAGLPEADSYRAVAERLDMLLGHLPRPVRNSRHDQVHTLVVGTVAGWEWTRARGLPHLCVGMLIDELIATGSALVGAPLPGASKAHQPHHRNGVTTT